LLFFYLEYAIHNSYTLSLHDALPIYEELNLAEGYEILEPTLSNNLVSLTGAASTMNKIDKVIVEITSDETKINEDILLIFVSSEDRKSTRLNSSHVSISYAVFCLKKK